MTGFCCESTTPARVSHSGKGRQKCLKHGLFRGQVKTGATFGPILGCNARRACGVPCGAFFEKIKMLKINKKILD
jgi:hypothetical protein